MHSHADSVLSTFTAGDGDNLALQHWPVPEGTPRRGIVVLVHGLGEHAGRYERLARRLTWWGFTVVGYDQCGHGESSGARGCVPTTLRLIDDLADVVESTGRRLREGEKLFVLGHGLGGLVACCYILLRQPPIDGLVLSAPALRVRPGPWRQLLLAVLPRVAPDVTLASGVRPEGLSHDPDVVEAYQADPLVHGRVSARLARFLVEAGPRVLARARQWRLPTLLLWGASDPLVDPRGCQAFAAAASPEVVTAHAFPDLYHEVFNELEAEPAYAALRAWLDQRA